MKPADAARVAATAQHQRLRGLKPAQADQLRRAMQMLQAGDAMMSGQLLLDLARSAPEHPELLRCRAQWHAAAREWAASADFLSRSLALRPGGFADTLQLAHLQGLAGDHTAALAGLPDAAAMAATAADWLALSLECDLQGCVEWALAHVQQALVLDPRSAVALLQRARCATALGQADLAAADCRALLERQELTARAWFMLGDLKVVKLSEAELAALQHAATAPPPAMPAEERLLLQFALGNALVDAGRSVDAFAALQRANQSAAASRPWDKAAFRSYVDAVQAAFGAVSAAAPDASAQGGEVIFLIGLPRSGTTLIEQVLASHSTVEGASELPYLSQVLEEESRRRGRTLAQWAASATDEDWARMGRQYLALSARWRQRRPVATDKLPDNWLYAGAAMRMLPGARVIDCRRDAVETCWSCYRQLFGPGMAHYSYTFEGLAAYWQAYDSLGRFWAERHPGQYRVQHYERLVADAAGEIRALLSFCGLDFEDACLHFHTAQRAIRTPSSLQVRQPMRQASTPAARMGALLDPLRALLASR